MNDIENKIIDRLNGSLNDAEWAEVLEQSKGDPLFQELYQEYVHIFDQIDNLEISDPNPQMQKRFDSYLEKEISENDVTSKNDNKVSRRLIPAYFQRAAIFLFLLVAGLLIGLNINKDTQTNLLAEAEYDRSEDMLNLLSQESSSTRIKAVNMSYEINSPHADIIDALIKTLHSDKSANVRLAAAEALSKFENNTSIRSALIKSLESENDEHLQIALINILANLKEKAAIESFDRIIQNDQSVKFVKDMAHSGKLKLSETY